MSDTQQTQDEATQDKPAQPVEEKQQDRHFTQAELDRIVSDRIARERARFQDYDELKAKASASRSLEERLAELETVNKAANVRALRSDVAARFKLGAEDRDLFLTGSDEESLVAQATRLSAALEARTAPKAPKPNPAQQEVNPPADDADAVARAFFGIK